MKKGDFRMICSLALIFPCVAFSSCSGGGGVTKNAQGDVGGAGPSEVGPSSTSKPNPLICLKKSWAKQSTRLKTERAVALWSAQATLECEPSERVFYEFVKTIR
jgi:hypothetical protein